MTLFIQKTDKYFLNSARGCLLGNLTLKASKDIAQIGSLSAVLGLTA